jgi:NADH-quinone oxidoreductase subunit L
VDSLVRTPLGKALHQFWFVGWGFDWLYDRLLVRPFVWVARSNRSDFFDQIYAFIAWVARVANGTLSDTQTGRLRWYAAGIAFGGIVAVAIVVLI